MFESEFSLFEVQSKGVLCNAMKLSQPMFGIAPKRFNPVDMLGASYKFIVAVINPEMPINANIHKPIVATPTIGMDHAVGVNFATNNALQRGFGGVGDDLGVDAVASFEKTKHNGFAACSATSLASNAFRPEVGLIGLEFTCEGGLSCAYLSHTGAGADALVDGVGAAKRQARELGCISRCQIKCEKPHKLAKFGFVNFRTALVPVFPNHFKRLACFEHMLAS